MPKFLLVGHGSFANRGCEAIVRTTVGLLRERWPGCGVSLASMDPATDGPSLAAEGVSVLPYTSAAHPGRWTREWLIHQLRRRVSPAQYWRSCYRDLVPAIRSADCVLSVGGDNYDYGLPRWLIAINDLASDLRKPIVVWGASVGPIPDAAKRAAILRDLGRVSLITARETLTQEFLDSHGLSDRTRLVADPAFLLAPEPVDTDAFWPAGDLVLGLNVSPLLKRFHQSKEDDRFPQMVAEFIDSVVHLYGLGVLLIPHVLHDGPNNDYTYMATVADMVGAHERVRLVPSHYNACQMKHVISKCDLLVAARTHATIAGFSSAVPTISLAYSQKAHGINRDLFGDGRWVVDSRTLTESRALVARVDEMLEGRQATSHRLRQIMPDVGARARSAVDHLASLM